MSDFAPVKIYYWGGMFGRAAALIRILEEAGAPYEVISDFMPLGLFSAFGADATDNFAPPLIVDGDECISQSTACAMHVGNKHGLNKGIANPAKAVQFMADLVDLFEIGIAGAQGKGGAALKAFLEGDRLPKILGNIERSIQGPFYFGVSPTYVDFLLCHFMDWHYTILLQRLKDEKGVDVFGKYAKISAAVAGIRGLASYVNYKGGLVIANDNFKAKDELFAEYK